MAMQSGKYHRSPKAVRDAIDTRQAAEDAGCHLCGREPFADGLCPAHAHAGVVVHKRPTPALRTAMVRP
jgi:hypothetical protein